jgi:hypothetical protein
MNQLSISEETGKINLTKNEKSFHENNEMLNLDSIYELLNNCLKIKEIFNDENFFREHIIELNTLLDNINNKNVKEI